MTPPQRICSLHHTSLRLYCRFFAYGAHIGVRSASRVPHVLEGDTCVCSARFPGSCARSRYAGVDEGVLLLRAGGVHSLSEEKGQLCLQGWGRGCRGVMTAAAAVAQRGGTPSLNHVRSCIHRGCLVVADARVRACFETRRRNGERHGCGGGGAPGGGCVVSRGYRWLGEGAADSAPAPSSKIGSTTVKVGAGETKRRQFRGPFPAEFTVNQASDRLWKIHCIGIL